VRALLGAALKAIPPALLEAAPSLLSLAPTVLVLAPALLSGCAGLGHDAGPAKAGAMPVLQRQDVLWLQRVSFGIDSESVAELHRLGRARYLDRQLQARESLPAPIAAELSALEASRVDAVQAIEQANTERKAANSMPDGPDREAARKAYNDSANRLAYQAVRSELLRATYSPDQLQEEMVWFWLNHFSVHQAKADLRWLVADYTDQAIRPHALGRFKDLVLATLEHPAMMAYLDNNQNAAGHVNENYARELMELHTLGVDGGYTQRDVQQLALVLTGSGVRAGDPPKLKPAIAKLYYQKGAFQFNPARHDFSTKVVLGRTIQGRGFDEVDETITWIVRQPSCAHFISRELATYFVADNPPPQLVDRMAKTFQRTDGDISAVLRVMLLSPEIDAALGGKFKDPTRFVVSAVRFAYDGRTITNTRPMLNWLNGLGETPFGRPTPDGYPLTEAAWASSGQMSRRFEIARAIGSGSAALFDAEEGAPAVPPPPAAFPQLPNRLYFEAVEPFLTARTREALGRAKSQQEWNTFLLASPDFNYE
jgi:uncharacterized protein (DUF1800 family)